MPGDAEVILGLHWISLHSLMMDLSWRVQLRLIDHSWLTIVLGSA